MKAETLNMPIVRARRPPSSNARQRLAVAAGVLAAVLLMGIPGTADAQAPSLTTPYFSLGMASGDDATRGSAVLQIFLLMTVLSLAPAILTMVTSFTRIVIVLSLLRRALGTNQLPSNQIVIGLAIFLTVFIMAPVWQKIHQSALQP